MNTSSHFVFDKKQTKVLQGDWSTPAPRVSIKTERHTRFIYTDFFSICWVSGFTSGSRTFFHRDQYGRWRLRKPGLLYQAFYDLGSNDMLMGLSPHTVCSERFMRLPVVLYRICASVLWERCNELMLEICRLLWVFFFSFQALLLTFFWDPFCCWITLHSCWNTRNHIGSVVWSNNQNDMLLFRGCLTELYLHLYVCNNHTGDIMFKWTGNNNANEEALCLKITSFFFLS